MLSISCFVFVLVLFCFRAFKRLTQILYDIPRCAKLAFQSICAIPNKRIENGIFGILLYRRIAIMIATATPADTSTVGTETSTAI